MPRIESQDDPISYADVPTYRQRQDIGNNKNKILKTYMALQICAKLCCK